MGDLTTDRITALTLVYLRNEHAITCEEIERDREKNERLYQHHLRQAKKQQRQIEELVTVDERLRRLVEETEEAYRRDREEHGQGPNDRSTHAKFTLAQVRQLQEEENKRLQEEESDFDFTDDESPTPARVQMPPLQQREALLDDAIKSASQEELARLLLLIVAKHPDAHKQASAHLLVPSKGSSTLKRKAYEICRNCRAEFHVESNEVGDCVYHDGVQDMDDSEDFWADDEWEGPHDHPLTLYGDDPEFEEGFIMTCCNQRPSAEGCKKGQHQPVFGENPSPKRGRQF